MICISCRNGTHRCNGCACQHRKPIQRVAMTEVSTECGPHCIYQNDAILRRASHCVCPECHGKITELGS